MTYYKENKIIEVKSFTEFDDAYDFIIDMVESYYVDREYSVDSIDIVKINNMYRASAMFVKTQKDLFDES